MDYQAFVERAMKGVVRDVLLQVAEEGLPGEHHLYITFHTEHDGVEIADRLIAQYPDEMTIILQHQFWGLEISEDAFEVTLSFSGKNERLYIPFNAVIGFADPSVNFGLQFKTTYVDDSNEDMPDSADSRPPEGLSTELAKSDDARKKTADEKADGEQNIGEVVALDAFRKNKT
ncbi:MAG: ClpXP protease specificity-enhancing factor SspB [Pseudomonadota bacterium]|nr:ClpXP protease specificity-enhancing factor SspB [Pseudomonadota bacterium]